jgi:hypothetical protein
LISSRNSLFRTIRTISLAQFGKRQVISTPGALDALNRAGQDAWQFIGRHVAGDWGELDEHDRSENEVSVREGTEPLR